MFKNIWFQIHWFIGITAGTILMAIGIAGGILSFREEIMDVLNPGVMHVAVRAQAPLTPQQLLEKIRADEPDERVTAMTVSATPGDSVRVNFAPPPGQRRGEARYVDPYTGQLFAPIVGMPFFEWVERFHRWLLLPVEIGKIVLGTLALVLLTLALSGLYLRWPRRPLSLQAWFKLDFKLQGRSFLWNLHSVLGTWALVMYVIFATTGAYWALDWFKQGVNTLAGETRPPQAARAPGGNAPNERAGRGERGGRGEGNGGSEAKHDKPPPLDLTLAWNAFLAKAPQYENAQLRLPERATQPLQIQFLAADAPHERARSRMTVIPQSGEVRQFELYSDKTLGGKFIAAIYPLHMGTFFGLPGRIIMTVTSLMMPLFGITGWMLYLDRRRKKAALRAERARLSGIAPTSANDAQAAGPYLVVHASQTGQAERVALHTAALLRRRGFEVTLLSLARITPDKLRHHPRILFIVSTFGEGVAPDSARAFERRMRAAAGESLDHVEYALLALGDRNYVKFCGFGHSLDHWLRSGGAKALFPLVEVDRMQATALQKWEQQLAANGIIDAASAGSITMAAPAPASDWRTWTLSERLLLNQGSQGEGIFHLELRAANDAQGHNWQPGALAEVLPHHAPDRVALVLQRLQLDGDTMVQAHGQHCSLRQALARSVLPLTVVPMRDATSAAQALADSLQPLAARSYSIASVPQDGAMHLLVRQARHEDGLGLASGWLTAYAQLGTQLQVRLVDNAGFAPAALAEPAIFIGNGSGMAGLRGHLRARVRAGQSRNWLLFGERNRAHDFLYQAELEQWLANGDLTRLDLAFSRDQGERVYVQDRLLEADDELRRWVAEGAVIFVCGSLQGMAAGVDAALSSLLGQQALEDLIEQNRYRRDVY